MIGSKVRNVTAVYKHGLREDPSNYRPISVVPIIAKLLERLVASQLNSYCEENQLLSPYQGAYRSGRSTEQILLFAVDTIANALDCRQTVCAAFLDLRKAFDSLDHVLLLERLGDMGVQGIELSWFTNYLSQRVQRVKVRDKVSSWSPVKGGVPQGSALGPLLFLVYVNAMPSLVKYGRLLQFADDTTLICTGGNRDEVQWKLEHDLRLLLDWIHSSKMKLNITKSSLMWFKPKRDPSTSPPPVFIDGQQLQEVEEQKYLGIIFDSKLQWGPQVNYICKKASYYLYLLCSHRKSLTHDILKMLTESLILSRFDYALPVWGPPLQKCQVTRLQRLHNRAIRVTKSLRKYDHITRHRNNLNWLPISYQIKFRSIHAMLRYYRQDIGCLLLDPPIQFGRQHSYQTRCRENFANVAMCRLTSTMRHFRFAASTWWNSLPTHIHDNNVNFINVVRKFYLDDCLS